VPEGPPRLGIGTEEGGGNADQHDQAHDDIDAPPGDMIRHDQGQGAADQNGETVAHDPDPGAGAPFFRGEVFRPVGVQDDVLAGAEEGQRDGPEGDDQRLGGGTEKTHGGNGGDQGPLGDEHPSPPPAQKGGKEAIQQRRPEKFERVGETDERKDPDRLDVHALRDHPRGEGGAGQGQGHPRGKAQNQHEEHLFGEIDPEEGEYVFHDRP